MANRPTGYGMTAELAAKKDAKWDSQLANDAIEWMRMKLGGGELPDIDTKTDKELHEALKSGVVLCHLINVLLPGAVKKINESKMAFKQMENIGHFLDGCETLGCNKVDLFQTVDLYESQNMPQVLNGILALGRKDGTLGPKESEQNKREFTDAQMRAGDGVIGLQAGSNKGANQSGQNFGKSRMIID
ncbi:myophilin-like [Lineus longissimus]|uniref:myophilin-like n=1 Tax=Lineus longissimus TaxID=88925 RepID=UPI002B4F8577